METHSYSERPEIPAIEELVAAMQDFALKHPYDPADVMRGIVVDGGCQRVFTYEGVELYLILSVSRHGTQRFWSLSIVRVDEQPMTDEWVEPFASHFFQDTGVAGPVIVNPMSAFAPNLKQYGQIIAE